VTPFRDNGHLTARQKQFNSKLSSIRSVIERSFQLLKGSWRKLLLLENVDIETMVKIIMSCFVLHNFCLLHDDFDDGYFLAGDDDDGDDGGGNDGQNQQNQQAAERKRLQLMNIIC